ncbi:Crp/Fnr family transcriptional regulator [Ancylobacter polymorphus]|uniref:Crp/Fnr family transcriptional regulator n=1 Tax=Ancylobacter polymorphus TaxID=223390 RepID=A0A9E7A0Y2_9HYPH|nr:Crp/Fnr family transcriptional regulator [Ancylobacter polymorphus]UOK72450.1 Crp/Fnr family transcriptional regulator [Ancylobacter polymorphus]
MYMSPLPADSRPLGPLPINASPLSPLPAAEPPAFAFEARLPLPAGPLDRSPALAPSPVLCWATGLTVGLPAAGDTTPLYRVAKGCLALMRQLDAERRQILDILGPGRLLDAAMLARLEGTAVTLAPTELAPVAAPPELCRRLRAENQELLLVRALGHVTRLGRQSAGERVAAALLDLAAQFAPAGAARGPAVGFPLHLGRGDLADWLGLTLETVSRCMSRLREEGLIAFGREGGLVLEDPAALARVAVGARKVEALYAAKGRPAGHPADARRPGRRTARPAPSGEVATCAP